MTSPYKQTAFRYWTHGWQGPLPIGTKPQEKTPPPPGHTGTDGAWPSEEQIIEWSETRADHNIGLRLPRDIIGLDVDDYDDKPGADTMTATTETHGRLPRTWTSTSRQGLSGIRWYRHPTQTTLPGKLVHPTNPDVSGVEVIQHSHRYAVVPPSIHPTGDPYVWISPDGERIEDGTLPKPDDFPELPQAWLDHINQTCSCRASFDYDKYTTTKDPVEDAYNKWKAKLTPEYGRHDAALGGIMALKAFEQKGWPGATHYLDQLHQDFVRMMGDDREDIDAEWQRMVDGAEKKAHTTTIPQWGPRTTQGATPDTFEQRVNEELDKIKVRDTARRRYKQETNANAEVPPLKSLTERLANPQPPVAWRIEGWQPADTRVLLAAQYKAGKTTLTGNLARSLVDGEPWLDNAPVNQAEGQVTILDFEMSERQIDEWLDDQGIANTDQVTIAPLRGKAQTFDILDDTTRSEWACETERNRISDPRLPQTHHGRSRARRTSGGREVPHRLRLSLHRSGHQGWTDRPPHGTSGGTSPRGLEAPRLA